MTANHSWLPVDLVSLRDTPAPLPTISGLSYPGSLALHYGEPEAAKSWLNLIICLEQIRMGRSALWLDFEMSPASVSARLRELGATVDELQRFLYLQPAEPLSDQRANGALEALLAEHNPIVAVVDAMAGGLALLGLDPNSGSDIERFYGAFVAPLRATGAAVHVVDHVVKDRETRGRWPIGSQRKLGAADIGISVEMVKPFGRGRTGTARLRVMKDRHGSLLRPLAAELELHSDADTGTVTWTFNAAGADSDQAGGFRPTVLMDRTLEFLAAQTEPISRKAVTDAVHGKREWLIRAIDQLVTEKRITETPGARGAKLLTLPPVPSSHLFPEQVNNGNRSPVPVPLLQGEQVREQVNGNRSTSLERAQ